MSHLQEAEPRVGMKQNPLLALALSVLTACSSALGRDRTSVVIGQPLSGRRSGGATTVVLGMPVPRSTREPGEGRTRPSDNVPMALGSTIHWRAFTLDGRAVGEGTAEFTEAGGRRLLLSAREVGGRGPRVVICQGLQGGSLWRRLLWVSSP